MSTVEASAPTTDTAITRWDQPERGPRVSRKRSTSGHTR